MKPLLLLILSSLISLIAIADPTDISPSAVAVLYNSTQPESKELAEYYAKARNIPADNLIGLATSVQGKISRAEYNKTIRDPLRAHFSSKRWWVLQSTAEGYRLSSKNAIQVLVCMRGIPFGINPDATFKLPEGEPPNALNKMNCASVDSELAICSIHDFPIQKPHQNKYFKQDTSFSEARIPYYMLVGRIDDANLDTCKRMIDDAIEVEKTGLFGMCYLDQAKKGGGYTMGDQWIQAIEKQNWEEGIPTTMEKTRDTYLTNYPMRDVALYYGWYTSNKNGPFLNPNFKLKKGSVAIHLHSFSASNLRNHQSNWTGPIMKAGAAATVGNVYEPFLGGTHHFDILNDRLLKGYTLIEATYMSIPLLSWQNLVIGDPLYRPFKNIDTRNEKPKGDKFYQATRVGFKAWQDDPELLARKFRSAAQKTKDARYYEIVGLLKRFQGISKEAMLFFSSAEKLYLLDSDKTRMKIHAIDILREYDQKEKAILVARQLHEEIKGTPEQQTIKSILNILSPPPPPKATPKDTTKKPTPKQPTPKKK